MIWPQNGFQRDRQMSAIPDSTLADPERFSKVGLASAEPRATRRFLSRP
jgi:hypothetical protein